GRAFRNESFRFAFLSAKTALFVLERRVSGVEKACRLAAKVNCLSFCVIARKCFCLTCKRDRFFNERAKLFGFLDRRDDVLFFRIDQRRRHVPEHRHTVLGGSAQFSVCFFVSHFFIRSSAFELWSW